MVGRWWEMVASRCLVVAACLGRPDADGPLQWGRGGRLQAIAVAVAGDGRGARDLHLALRGVPPSHRVGLRDKDRHSATSIGTGEVARWIQAVPVPGEPKVPRAAGL